MKNDRYPDPLDEENEKETDAYDEKKGLFVTKGFYSVLAICLLAVGGVAAATFIDTRNTTLSETEATSSVSSRIVSAAPVTTTRAAPVAAPTASSATQPEQDEEVSESETTASKANTALFVLPLSNDVINPFSDQPVYNATMGDYRTHLGIDYGGKDAQIVRALADGEIAEIAADPLWGEYVILDHGGGITSKYCGITTVLEVGAHVGVGDDLGKLSGVPCESKSEPHLHLELYKNGEAIDASGLLGGQVALAE